MNNLKVNKKDVINLCSEYYEVGDILGQGAFAIVYRAKEKGCKKRIVALKCIDLNHLLAG